MRAFETMHNQISQLKSGVTSPDTSTPNPRDFEAPSHSMSFDNLADESPVVSLLREYSVKLIGLVHNQAESKGNSTAADTV